MKTVLYGLNGAAVNYINKSVKPDNFIIVTTNGNEKLAGFSSISLDNFIKYDFNKIEKLIICSSMVSEIYHSLVNCNFPENKIFCYDTYNVEISSCSNIKQQQINKADVLYAFYDLANNWVTFDSVAFGIIAEIERIKRNKKHIHFIIVPDYSCNSEFIGAYKNLSSEEKHWRINHIVKAVFSCIPTTLGVSHLAYREEADLFASSELSCLPDAFYSAKVSTHFAHNMLNTYLQNGYNLSVFRAPAQAKKLVTSYLSANAANKKILVINLREYDIQSSRNSRLEDWARFLQEIDTKIYFPLVIRDFYSSTEPLPDMFKGIDSFPTAAVDFAVRVALFEQAFLNMSITNGAFYVTNYLAGVAAITFIQLDDNNPCMSTQTFERCGYSIGENTKLRDNENQIIVWAEDSYENISNAFLSMIQQLENQ